MEFLERVGSSTMANVIGAVIAIVLLALAADALGVVIVGIG